MSKYLLPCECGQAVPVEVSQAGQSVPCGCGRTLNVPSLRAIRQLPPAVESVPTRGATSQWRPWKGALFMLGGLLFLGGLGTTAYAYNIYRQVIDIKPPVEALNTSLQLIGDMTAPELYEAWKEIQEHGMEPVGSTIFFHAQEEASHDRSLMKTGAVVALVGLILAIIPSLIPSSPRQK